MNASRRVLVTGASGYIARRMIPLLRRRGHSVMGLVRSEDTLRDDDTELLVADLREPVTLEPRDWDVVVHLAGANDVDSRDPRAALLDTTLATRHMLDFALRTGARRFVYFSTLQVYGAEWGPIDEHTPLRPRNDYGASHRFAEELVEMTARSHGLDFAILRPANVYGAPERADQDRWSLVPGCFCRQVAEEGRITLRSSGLQARDFVSLDRVASFTEAIVRHRGPLGTAVNVASGESLSILECAKLVRKEVHSLLGRPCELEVLGDEPHVARPLEVATGRMDALDPRPRLEKAESELRREIRRTLMLLGLGRVSRQQKEAAAWTS